MAKKAARKKNGQDAADTPRRIAALKARIKVLEKGKLTRTDRRDLAWLEKIERAEVLEAWKAAVPKGEYCQLAGRQHKLIDDAARNYDLPLEGATIDLRTALTALHDLLAANGHRLRKDLDGDREELEEEKLRQQIVGLEIDNERKGIDLKYSRGDAIEKEKVKTGLITLSARLRKLGQTLSRIDPDARRELNDFLENLAIEVEEGDLAF